MKSFMLGVVVGVVVIIGIGLSFPPEAEAQNCSLCCQPPLTCPPVSQILLAGFTPFVVQDLGGNYFAGSQGQGLGTMSLWTFQLGPFLATSALDAFNKANTIAQTLHFKEGPLQLGSCTWQCTYTTQAGVQAITITPPIGCFNPTAP